jgi:hypothetical protein
MLRGAGRPPSARIVGIVPVFETSRDTGMLQRDRSSGLQGDFCRSRHRRSLIVRAWFGSDRIAPTSSPKRSILTAWVNSAMTAVRKTGRWAAMTGSGRNHPDVCPRTRTNCCDTASCDTILSLSRKRICVREYGVVMTCVAVFWHLSMGGYFERSGISTVLNTLKRFGAKMEKATPRRSSLSNRAGCLALVPGRFHFERNLPLSGSASHSTARQRGLRPSVLGLGLSALMGVVPMQLVTAATLDWTTGTSSAFGLPGTLFTVTRCPAPGAGP